jgi:hypothetical protein
LAPTAKLQGLSRCGVVCLGIWGVFWVGLGEAPVCFGVYGES